MYFRGIDAIAAGTMMRISDISARILIIYWLTQMMPHAGRRHAAAPASQPRRVFASIAPAFTPERHALREADSFRLRLLH